MNTEYASSVERFLVHARQYQDNALIALQKGEAAKAGELLWGSLSEAIHALAAYKSVPLDNHWKARAFAFELAKELNDPSIADGFAIGELLHRNYYDVQMEPRDVEIHIPRISKLVERLVSLIPQP